MATIIISRLNVQTADSGSVPTGAGPRSVQRFSEPEQAVFVVGLSARRYSPSPRVHGSATERVSPPGRRFARLCTQMAQAFRAGHSGEMSLLGLCGHGVFPASPRCIPAAGRSTGWIYDSLELETDAHFSRRRNGLTLTHVMSRNNGSLSRRPAMALY